MATREIVGECAHCGQKIRGNWIRCPRCHELAQGSPLDAGPLPIPDTLTPRVGRMALAAGIMIVVVAAAGVSSRLTGGSEAFDSSTAIPDSGSNEPSTTGRKPIEPAALPQYRSDDERRAGYAAYATGDLDAALARFQAAVEANPDDPEARNSLGQVMVRQGRATDALPHFDEAVRIDSGKWSYRFNRARAYAQLNRFPDAITDYRTAIDMFPDDYATHYNLGLVYLKTRQYAEAVASLERAVSLAPGDSSFLVSLATAYVGVEQPQKAKAAFEKFLEVAADDDPEVPRVKAAIEALEGAGNGSPN